MRIFRGGKDEHGRIDRRFLSDEECTEFGHKGGFRLDDGPVFAVLPGYLTCEGSPGLASTLEFEHSLAVNGRLWLDHLGGPDVYEKGLQFYRLMYDRAAFNSWADYIVPRSIVERQYGRTSDVLSFMQDPSGYISETAMRMAEVCILPSLLDERGHFRPYHDVAHCLSNLNLGTDSYGGTVATQLENYLRLRLTRAPEEELATMTAQERALEASKFTPEQTEALLRRVVHVGITNVTPLDLPHSMTTIRFQGIDDRISAFVQSGDRRGPEARSVARRHVYRILRGYRMDGLEAQLADPGLSDALREKYEQRLANIRHHQHAQDLHNVEELERARPPREERNTPETRLKLVEHPAGLAVHFYPELDYTYNVGLEEGPVTRRELSFYGHHTRSFLAPLPEHPENSVLLGRVLRRAPWRDHNRLPDLGELLTTPSIPANTPFVIDPPYEFAKDHMHNGWIDSVWRQRRKADIVPEPVPHPEKVVRGSRWLDRLQPGQDLLNSPSGSR